MAFSRSSLLNPPGASELSEPAKKSTVLNSKQGCIKTEKMRKFILFLVLFFVFLNLVNTLQGCRKLLHSTFSGVGQNSNCLRPAAKAGGQMSLFNKVRAKK